jgi:hypothetical protein
MNGAMQIDGERSAERATLQEAMQQRTCTLTHQRHQRHHGTRGAADPRSAEG